MTPEKAKELKSKVQAQYRDGFAPRLVDVFNALIDELTDKPVPQSESAKPKCDACGAGGVTIVRGLCEKCASPDTDPVPADDPKPLPCRECGTDARFYAGDYPGEVAGYFCPNVLCYFGHRNKPLADWNAANKLTVAELREGGTFEFEVSHGPWVDRVVGKKGEIFATSGSRLESVRDVYTSKRVRNLRQGPLPKAEEGPGDGIPMGAEHDPKPETVTLPRETAANLYRMVSNRTWCDPEYNKAFIELRAAMDRE